MKRVSSCVRPIRLDLPAPLAERADLALLSDEMDADFSALRAYLLKA